MMKRRRIALLLLCLAFVGRLFAQPALAQENKNGATGPILSRAVMCEAIEALEPHNTAAAFSITIGQISCFSSFEAISSETHVLHQWYRRDTLVSAKRLSLKPPSWSTYSSIQLREADKGPWRVEIRSADDRLLETLRFSVID